MDTKPLLSNNQKAPTLLSTKSKCILITLFLTLIIGSILFIIGSKNNQNINEIVNKSVFHSRSSSTSLPQNPNIIYIVVDDLGWSDVSIHGAEYDTPTIDGIVENESIFLQSHYVGLLCSPSRSQFLTGKYAFNMGLGALQPFGYQTLAALPHGVPLISNLLQKYSDYKTYALGKWHIGYATNSSVPLQRGFDYFYGFNVDSIFYINKTTKDGGLDWWENNEPAWDAQNEFSTIQISNKLGDIIAKHDKDNSEPFYIYTALQAVHAPLEKTTTEEVTIECKFIVEHTRRLYCQNVIEVDRLMNKLISNLKMTKNKLWDNTIIVFTTDNGGEMEQGGCNYPFRGYKGSYFEGAMKTFTFISGGFIPQSEYGTKRGSLFHGVDWTPTLLSLANIDIPDKSIEFDGYNMKQMILYGDDYNLRDEVPLNVATLYEYNNAIIFKYNNDNTKYKYILLNEDRVEMGLKEWCYYTKHNVRSNYQKVTPGATILTEFLFNLDVDSNETNNLLENFDDNTVVVKNKINTIIETAKLKLSKYRENIYYNDVLDCFSELFPVLAEPTNFNGVWKPFLSWQHYMAQFHDTCGDELDNNDNLKILHLSRFK